MKHPQFEKILQEMRYEKRRNANFLCRFPVYFCLWSLGYTIAFFHLLPPLSGWVHLSLFASVSGVLLAACYGIASHRSKSDDNEQH